MNTIIIINIINNEFGCRWMERFAGAEANSLYNEGGWCITFLRTHFSRGYGKIGSSWHDRQESNFPAPPYLGSLISWDLTDNSDVQQRTGLASKAFGLLRKEIYCNQSIKAVTRVWLFTAIVINLLLGPWIMDAGRWLLVSATISMFASIFGFVRFPEWPNRTCEPSEYQRWRA